MDTSRPTTSSRPRDAMDLHETPMAQSTRIGTASRLSALPANRLSTSKNIGILQKGMSDRPLTQQGLSGITTSYGRIGTGTAASSMRQVKDKRYWMALIQSKIQEIVQETDRLNREKKNLDRETSARKLYEKKVKEQAKELSTLHAKLAEMNLALDTGGNGASRQLLQNESVAIREKNEALQSQLEQVFRDRQAKESLNQQLEQTIASEKAKVDELIYSLSPEDQNKYREYQIISERLKSENAEIHARIEETVKRKEKLSANISSQSRIEAIKLQSKLRETIAKRNQLKDEEQNRLTPAQEREKLISEVRMNNQSISSIGKQTKIVADQLQEKREYLQQIDADLEEGRSSSDRYVKFKELKKRDEMMSSFLDSFPASLVKEKQNVEILKNQITFAIEQITLQGMSSKELGNVKISTAILNENSHNLNSHGGLVKEYSKLQIQLKQLSILEKRLKKQIEELRDSEVSLVGDIKKFSNTNALRDEYVAKYEEASTTLQELKDKKRVTDNVVKDAERRYAEVKDSLRSNETYRQISHMEEKLTDLLKDNKALQSSIDDFNKEFDFSETKRAAQQKVDDYNRLLCEDLRSAAQNKFAFAGN